MTTPAVDQRTPGRHALGWYSDISEVLGERFRQSLDSQKTCGVRLADRTTQFLGVGNWRPRSNYEAIERGARYSRRVIRVPHW